jgi:hypothetical protein
MQSFLGTNSFGNFGDLHSLSETQINGFQPGNTRVKASMEHLLGGRVFKQFPNVKTPNGKWLLSVCKSAQVHSKAFLSIWLE